MKEGVSMIIKMTASKRPKFTKSELRLAMFLYSDPTISDDVLMSFVIMMADRYHYDDMKMSRLLEKAILEAL